MSIEWGDYAKSLFEKARLFMIQSEYPFPPRLITLRKNNDFSDVLSL